MKENWCPEKPEVDNYVLRLVALYIGAILSPLIAMLWLIPAFKDFAVTALKTYLTLIFVLFVHAVIVLLGASILTGATQAGSSGQPNILMALIVGMATIIALLKTQGVMQELTYAASAPRAAREISSSFMRSAHAARAASRNTVKVSKNTPAAVKRIGQSMGFIAPDKKSSKSAKADAIGKSSGIGALKTGETKVAPNIKKGENK